MGILDEVLVCEEFSWGDPGFGTAAYSNGLTVGPVITGGTEDQKTEYLGRLVKEPLIASYCVTEPGRVVMLQAYKLPLYEMVTITF